VVFYRYSSNCPGPYTGFMNGGCKIIRPGVWGPPRSPARSRGAKPPGRK